MGLANLEVLTAQSNELRLFWIWHSSYFNYLCRTPNIAAVVNILTFLVMKERDSNPSPRLFTLAIFYGIDLDFSVI